MKKMILLLAMVSAILPGKAQEVDIDVMEVPVSMYSVETNPFWSNWFVSAAGGIQVIYGKPTGDVSFRNRITPNMQLAVGKWFDPCLGLRTQFNGIWSKKIIGDQCSKFRYMNLHEDVLFNMSNIVCGYNPTRLYNMIPYAGMGVVHDFNNGQGWHFGVNAGLINSFRLSDAFSVQLELYALITERQFDGVIDSRRGVDGVYGASIGVTYNIGGSSWQNSPDVSAMAALSAAQLAALNQMLADAQAQNDSLSSQLAIQPKAQPSQTNTITLTNFMVAPQSIFFNINSSAFETTKDLINLRSLAELAQQNTNLILNVTGYADSNTGSPAYNSELSLARANTVADELVKLGVNRSQLNVTGDGGVDTVSPYEYNRRVVISAAD